MLPRIFIGFSPTIWASGYRTCGVMCVTCISGYLFVLVRNFDRNIISSKEKSVFADIMILIYIFEIINLILTIV